MTAMKKKTSINIDDKLWKQWLLFVVDKYGTAHKTSEAMGEAIKEYIQRHDKKAKENV